MRRTLLELALFALLSFFIPLICFLLSGSIQPAAAEIRIAGGTQRRQAFTFKADEFLCTCIRKRGRFLFNRIVQHDGRA